MASNILPTISALLIALGTKMKAGLVALGSALGITQITPAGFQTLLDAFIASDAAYIAARSARQAASDGYQQEVVQLTNWLQKTRNVLAGVFGPRWSTQWAQAGFITPSTQVPENTEEKLGLALRLIGFFTANPSYEVASMNVTAAEGTLWRNATLNAQQTLATATVTLKSTGDSDQSAGDALRAEMRMLIGILTKVLGRNDPRWVAFGLNIPAADTTPGQVTGVTATDQGMMADGTSGILLNCDPQPLATRYRYRMLIVGVETEYRLVASSTEPMASATGVVPGQTVEIIAQAVNGGSQGVASEPIQYTVPLPLSATAQGAQADVPLVEVSAPVQSPVAPALELNEVAPIAGSLNGHAPVSSRL